MYGVEFFSAPCYNITMDEILDILNEEQLAPVTDTEGAVLVLAGAGSGKTRVLTSRIAYILREGLAKPRQILAITFTNKAAGEMRERLYKMLDTAEDMWICTIHSMCVRILRKYGDSIGVSPNFSIYSETERNNILKKVIKEQGFNDEKLLKSAKFHIGNAKNLGYDPDRYGREYAGERGIEDIVRIYKAYDERLSSNNSLDFDDLLLVTLRLLRKDEEVRSILSDRFKYVSVDEFQDTNKVQYEIIKLLAKSHGNLFVVGDDDQSIYGWRGAEIKNILQFDKDYPSAKIYKLQRNYRSTGSIISLANEIIKHNGSRRDKTLWTDRGDGERPEYYQADEETGEAMYASRVIVQAVRGGAKYSDFAVLMRINALTRSYEQEFNKYGIPYKVFGGFRFFERKEIKDVMAYLRLISNPFDDEAFTRIINVPRRGIGERTMEIVDEYARAEGVSLYQAALAPQHISQLTSSAQIKLKTFGNLIKEFVIDSQTMTVSEIVKKVISGTEMRSAYMDGTDEGDSKLANIDEFVASVEDFTRLNPLAGLEEFINQITLASDTDDINEGEYVTLATIHSVKGLEFKQVILCGLEDGIMPTSRAENDPADMEEERRLMYVAVTRAQDKLYLTRSKSRYLYGKREPTRPSRFIAEGVHSLGLTDEEARGGAENYADYSGNFGSAYRGGYGGYKNGYNRGYGGNNNGSGYKSGGYSGGYGGRQYQKKAEDDFGYQSDIPSGGSGYGGRVSGGGSAAKSYGGYTGKQNKAAAKYSVGNIVEHKKYGIGIVCSVSGGGAVIRVDFRGKGVVELSAAFAPLKIISEN